MSRPPAANVLIYVSRPAGTPRRNWRVASWLGVAYLLLLVLFLASDVWPMRFHLTFLKGAKMHPYVVAFTLIQTIPPALACMNVLPVAGCALGVRSRCARKPLLVYAAVQGSLVALMLGATAYVVWTGRFQYSAAPNRSAGIVVEGRALVVAAAASVLLSLPLLALLVARVRRACAPTESLC